MDLNVIVVLQQTDMCNLARKSLTYL